jgi:hypothetical protein
VLLCCCKAHSVGDALAQRTCRHGNLMVTTCLDSIIASRSHRMI